jgi:hypothetical protein
MFAPPTIKIELTASLPLKFEFAISAPSTTCQLLMAIKVLRPFGCPEAVFFRIYPSAASMGRASLR